MAEVEQKIKGKVLVVDDLDENLFAMQQILKSLDAEVYTARSGEDALSLLLRHHFAIVLLDVQMPGMDGFETATIMRQSDELKLVPIIFISAISKEQEYVFKGYEKGAVDYIFKPVEPVIVRNKVQLFLELDAQREKLDRLNKQTETLLHQLTDAAKKNKQLLDSASEGILGFDPQGVITFVNKEGIRLLQQSEKNILGSEIQDYLTPHDVLPKPAWESSPINKAMWDNREYRISSGFLWRNNGTDFPVEYGCSPIINEEEQYTGGVMTFQDITVRKMAEEQLIHIAQYDELTDLANRELFTSTLSKTLLHTQRTGRCCGVLFLDLDNFKKINDTMGHSAGDELLISIAWRLKNALRRDDLPARFGGDEFAVLLSDLARNEDAFKVADTILKSMREPHLIQDEEVVVSSSIGISTYPECGSDAAVLMKSADRAMYYAKQQGKNNFKYFSEQMQHDAERRFVIEVELKKALQNNEFVLVYQPQVEACSGKVVGVVALLRWNSAKLGWVEPSEFIPIAEEAGLVSQMSRWMIETVYEQSQIWSKSEHHFSNITLVVNFSLVQFAQALHEVYEHFIATTTEPSESEKVDIDIEINEMALKDSPQRGDQEHHGRSNIENAIKSIHQMGFKIIIDDFGAGGISLSCLMRMPVDVLKVHHSFIAEIESDEFAEAIIRYLIKFAHEMGIKVIAEGVETMAQVKFLQQLQCDYLQGNRFSQPVILVELEKLPEFMPVA